MVPHLLTPADSGPQARPRPCLLLRLSFCLSCLDMSIVGKPFTLLLLLRVRELPSWHVQGWRGCTRLVHDACFRVPPTTFCPPATFFRLSVRHLFPIVRLPPFPIVRLPPLSDCPPAPFIRCSACHLYLIVRLPPYPIVRLPPDVVLL